MTAPRTALLDGLDAEIADVRAFVALLEEERAVLLAGDADLLPAIVARKEELAQRLAARSRDQRRAVADAPATVLQALTRLRESAARAKSINEQNRTLVELRLQRASTALAVLLGGASSVASATYSAEGRTRAHPPGRSLAKA